MKTSPSDPTRLYLHPVATAVMVLLFAAAAYFMWRITQPVPELPTVTKTLLTPEAPAPETQEAAPPEIAPRATPQQTVATPPTSSDVVLSERFREPPGTVPAEWLYYRNGEAEAVQVAGAWNGWKKTDMIPVGNGVWAYPILEAEVPFGSYEFKFVIDGTWEGGANRLLYLNPQGLMERPPSVVARALIDHPHEIRITLYNPPEDPDAVTVRLLPEHGAVTLNWVMPKVDPMLSGYQMSGSRVEFVLNPAVYNLEEIRSASVAGNFNGWNPTDADTQLRRQADGSWRGFVNYGFIDSKVTDPDLLFKFVVNGESWLTPPEEAPNAMLEPGTPHMNLSLPRSGQGNPELRIRTASPIQLNAPPVLVLEGLYKDPLHVRLTPGAVLDDLASVDPMGVTLDRTADTTTYRLFAPRASTVRLGLFDGPYHTLEDGTPVEPASVLDLDRQSDGAWKITREGLNIGQYYAFQVVGPTGNGEGFQAETWVGDPYAKAVSLAEGNSIVMDLSAQTPSPTPRKRLNWEDMVIYETHLRHLTWDDSAGVDPELRGTYPGVLETRGTGTGLDHLKDLGVNVIQFLPIHEFNNGFEGRHDWGYATCFFFAPESSYATRPREGSQVAEFKQLVHELHQEGFAVFLDVVYNHIGGVNVFNQIDRKYYFRLNPDLTNQNFSGVGNDTASERPMMRRLIKESVLFWVEEYGIDGFRFDLAELIDTKTLSEIEREIRQKYPHVVLHSEPWSFRGHHKDFIGRTTWGAWNDQFREPAKRFVVGEGDLESVKKAVRGSVEGWARHPLQSVNYMESHDDLALTDELSDQPGNDGRTLSIRDEKIHKLAATLIFTSLGTPLIAEGQDFLRSKHGIRNSYNQGDEINALRWDERDRPHAREVLSYYRDIIAFRLSEAGRALRVSENPGLDYTRFLETDASTALGWIVNATNERPGVPMVMTLINTGLTEDNFEVDLPPGLWRMVGDGTRIQETGIPGQTALIGGKPHTLTVPPQTALMFRNGF